MIKKRRIPLVYRCYRDKILKHSNWNNKIHYSNAKTILGYFGLQKEVREDVLKELFRYNLLERENKHWITIVGAKKKSIFG